MPIYTPEEYPAVIERIKSKIAQKNISMGPTISETEIAAFESACNTRLPQAYRLERPGGGGHRQSHSPARRD